jgi:hypothetical protein
MGFWLALDRWAAWHISQWSGLMGMVIIFEGSIEQAMKSWVATITAVFMVTAHAGPVQAGSRVLVIGDSHCTMTFGKTLDEVLRSQVPGGKVSIYGSSSASTQYYVNGESSHGGHYFRDESGKISSGGEAPTPKLAKLLSDKPDFTVVALGSNQLGWGDKGQAAQIRATIRKIKESGSKCIWVGPPVALPDTRPGRSSGFVATDVDKLYKTLVEVTAAEGCQLVDSRQCAVRGKEGNERKCAAYPPYDPAKFGKHWDGMHFDAMGPQGVQMGRDWAQWVGSEVRVRMAKATVPQSIALPADPATAGGATN